MLPGPYTVNLAPAPSFALPATSLLVPNKDVTGLDIAMPAVKEVNVRVAVEGDAPVPNFGLIFVAVSGAAASSGAPISIPQDQTPLRTFANSKPGTCANSSNVQYSDSEPVEKAERPSGRNPAGNQGRF